MENLNNKNIFSKGFVIGYNLIMETNQDFYKTKKLSEMSNEEWEKLCALCGRCCFRKYVEGRGKKAKLYYTRICCNLFDIHSGKCLDYNNRLKKCRDCVRISPKKIKNFIWLPKNCAYRLLSEGKELPSWHPLVSGIPLAENPIKNQVMIQNPILERDVEYWEDYVVEVTEP